MTFAAILADFQLIMGVLSMAQTLAQDVEPEVAALINLWNGNAMSDAERAALEAKQADLENQIANA